MTKTMIYLAALCGMMGLNASSGMAQSPRASEIVQAGVRPGWQTETGTRMAAMHLTLAQDWITYWRHPGESGIVPRLDWTASDNLAQVRVHWPEPRLFTKLGVNSIGYESELVLPLELVPVNRDLPIRLDAVLSIGVCNDICIPVDIALRSDINDSGTRDARITAALSRTPTIASTAGLQDVSCTIEPADRGLRLTVQMELPVTGADEFMLIETPGLDLRSRVLPSRRDGDTITGQALLRASSGQMAGLDRSNVLINLVSENGVVTHQGCSATR